MNKWIWHYIYEHSQKWPTSSYLFLVLATVVVVILIVIVVTVWQLCWCDGKGDTSHESPPIPLNGVQFCSPSPWSPLLPWLPRLHTLLIMPSVVTGSSFLFRGPNYKSCINAVWLVVSILSASANSSLLWFQLWLFCRRITTLNPQP